MSFGNKSDEDRRVEAELEVMVRLNRKTRTHVRIRCLYSNYFVQRNELDWLLETEIPRLANIVDDLMKV